MDKKTADMIEQLKSEPQYRTMSGEIDIIKLAEILIKLEAKIDEAQTTADNIANNANISTI